LLLLLGGFAALQHPRSNYRWLGYMASALALQRLNIIAQQSAKLVLAIGAGVLTIRMIRG
jgi:hypothetical protein